MQSKFQEVNCNEWAEFSASFGVYMTERVFKDYSEMHQILTECYNTLNNGKIASIVRYHNNGAKQYFINSEFN